MCCLAAKLERVVTKVLFTLRRHQESTVWRQFSEQGQMKEDRSLLYLTLSGNSKAIHQQQTNRFLLLLRRLLLCVCVWVCWTMMKWIPSLLFFSHHTVLVCKLCNFCLFQLILVHFLFCTWMVDWVVSFFLSNDSLAGCYWATERLIWRWSRSSDSPIQSASKSRAAAHSNWTFTI